MIHLQCCLCAVSTMQGFYTKSHQRLSDFDGCGSELWSGLCWSWSVSGKFYWMLRLNAVAGHSIWRCSG